MIKAEERYLLLQAGFTDRQINTQIQKFYNLFRVAPMPQIQKNWQGLNHKHRCELWNIASKFSPESVMIHDFAKDIEEALKRKNT